MRKKIRITVLLVLVAMILITVWVLKSNNQDDFHEKYEDVDLTQGVESVERENTYSQYLKTYNEANYGSESIDIDILNYKSEGEVTLLTDYYGEEKVLYTGNDSYVEWEIKVDKAGFYNVYFEYLSDESRGVDIERSLLINGEYPFEGAKNLTFSRLWADGEEVKKDNQGNDIRPTQTEVFDWQSAYCKDDMGYESRPYLFYFQEGENTLAFESINEPMVLRKVSLEPQENLQDYSTYASMTPQVNMSEDAKNYTKVIQGEDSVLRSSPSLYAKYDRSAPNTEPYDVFHTVLNYVGGESWSFPGQWIEWEFEVPEDGYYNITIKGRQNYQRGSISCRTLYIDGKIPFTETEVIRFDYANEWDMLTLSDEDENPYSFYMEEGKHKIRLEVTLGDMGETLSELEDSVFRLNTIYRNILVLTGATPDEFRDYNLDKVYPDSVEAMGIEAKRLYKVVDDFVEYTGQKSEKIATAQTLAIQLESFSNEPNKITQMLGSFKDNITSLGTSILNMSESKLAVDYIVVSGVDNKPSEKKVNFLDKAIHEIKSFVASFVVDYDTLGNVYDEKESEVVEVWLVTGRDQSTILKSMVDDTFTPQSGISVNVKLVNASALLSAVVAGNGPDVVLSVDSALSVDYALRNAVEDLTQFDDYEEVLEQFYPSAYEPFKFEGGIYGLPETQTFNVLFYRKDIMEELDLEIPDTWSDIINILPTIQSNNMSVGMHYTNLPILYAMVYQNGGAIYNEQGTETVLSNEAGAKAFDTYTRLYTDYGIPIEFDFASRFRSGEMPIGVADFTTYNTLVVSAPEIRGLWDFTLLPGTEKVNADGTTTIDRSMQTAGVSCIMIKNKDEKVKQNAWEFMKWWVSTDTQVRFGREIESLLGSSARYATANKEAFEQLSWGGDQIKILQEQLEWSVGYREIPGGYYTARHITNAIRKVINDKEDARETLLDYTRVINDEIRKKRKEFGLSID